MKQPILHFTTYIHENVGDFVNYEPAQTGDVLDINSYRSNV